jgi:hypothetical protein
MTDKTLEDLERERDEAKARRYQFRCKLDAEARTAAREAEAVVRAKHEDELDRLTDEQSTAYSAWLTRLDVEATHPFEGRKVQRPNPSWTSREVQRGVIEVRRSKTQFGGNVGSYRIPDFGRAFVRLLKKDGTPGTNVAELYENEDGSPKNWKLVEEGSTNA